MPRLVSKRVLRIVLALGAFFVAALVLVACGGSSNSMPSDAVATVDGKAITKADYHRWALITAKGAATPGSTPVVPDPPAYTACIAALRKSTKTVKGQPKPTATTLRAQCKQLDQQIVQQTMSTLIQSTWIEEEAKKQGVKVSDADVNKALAQTKKQSFRTEKAYQKFLAQSGMTEADVLARLRIQTLAQKLTTKIQHSAAPVSDADVAKYYDAHKSQFAVPERRDLQLILTKTKAQADAAKAAVAGGMSWAAAAKKYSTDSASLATGGVLRGVAKGTEDRALDEAAFKAKKGQLVGPVKGQFGWYIVRVVAITPARQNTLAQATAQIKPLLTQQGQQQKLSSFITEFQARYKAATKCRTGYVVELCSNAPKPKTTSTSGGTVATSPSNGSSTSGK